MLYFLETKLPEYKSVYFALTNIYGIGEKTAYIICKKLGFSINLKIKNLTQEQITEMIQLVDSLNLNLNNELKNLKSLTLTNLVSIKSYKGLRRVRGLPVRGQRTHTNAKSARKHKHFKNLYE
jgi:small subunit ribosomal protein S13